MSIEFKIPIEYLSPGLYVRLDLPFFQRLFMKSEFLIQDQAQVARIKAMGRTHVGIVLEKCTDIPASILNMNGREKKPKEEPAQEKPEAQVFAALKQIKNKQQEWHKARKQRYQQCEKQYQKTFSTVTTIIRRVSGKAVDAVGEASQLIGGMVKVFVSDANVVLNLMNMKDPEERYQLHCMNVSVLSLMVGKRMGLSEEAMNHLGLGGMFHDIGKEMLRKAALMDEKAKHNIYKKHPAVGEALVAQIHTVSREVRTIILQHHEAMNGKGFPAGLAGDQIDRLASIVAIADRYDNLCNDLNAEKKPTPHQAVTRLYRSKEEFDPEILQHFIRTMGIYPPGSVVQLSTDEIGLVISVDPRKPLLPSVLLYNEKIPKNEAQVMDLGEEEGDLRIVKGLHPDDLPREVFAYLSPARMVGYSADAL